MGVSERVGCAPSKFIGNTRGQEANWGRGGGGSRKERCWEEGSSSPPCSIWILFPGEEHATLILGSGKGLDTALPRNLGL